MRDAPLNFLWKMADFDYIESGSLLGVRYKEVPSYAVGFEEIVYMYPMNLKGILYCEWRAEIDVRDITNML